MGATKRVYETLVWLRAVNHAGFAVFTHAELRENNLGNKPCLMQARRAGFIERVSKDRSSFLITWKINETKIQGHNKKKVYFGE